ncbi:hypothetical protein VCHA56P521_110176 [Vibrio chagasii]|nr:hypothetical protein VCHA34P114_100166 [Vibrio chagasii]CAH6957783.1 hypothetical protein VCHA50O387_100176 [Vibrio chagasii]CAH6958004.1 hypothetical protein VCHA50O404_100175 [Vibrio chagasii]CAH7113720.1 hypothetical protein VCHA50O384_100016 [Vibrio chagasii]CAH7142930.1 hypothetical protein VCHA56P521_110176 [Vibrio chagasii]
MRQQGLSRQMALGIWFGMQLKTSKSSFSNLESRGDIGFCYVDYDFLLAGFLHKSFESVMFIVHNYCEL